jgi:hypothetical protein
MAAWQFEHCRAMGLPQESQNFAPSRTWLWQLPHWTVLGGGGVGCGAGWAGGGA